MKIRYAIAALIAAAASLVGNVIYLLSSTADRITLTVSQNGLGAMTAPKWVLLLFGGAALAFTAAYLLMRLDRARKEKTSAKPRLEDRAMLIASAAVAVMGWIASLILL